MAVSVLVEQRVRLLRALGVIAVRAGGPYPRKGVITVPEEIMTGEVPGRLTLWAYPDGGVECRVTELPMESAPGVCVHQTWWGVDMDDRLLNREHANFARCEPVANALGERVGYSYHEHACPAQEFCEQWIAQVANAERAARKAASKARRVARANQLTYMSTLTIPGKVGKDRLTVTQLWRRFMKREGARFYHAVKGGHLAFPEPHPKSPDTFHLHVLHRNRINAVRIRYAWTRFLLRCGYELPAGTRWVRTHEKDWGKASRAADYAAKYLKKAFGFGYGRQMGQHRYLSSQGLLDVAVCVERDELRRAIVELVSGGLAECAPAKLAKESEPDDYLWWSWAAFEPLGEG